MVIGVSALAEQVRNDSGPGWITPGTTIGEILVHPVFDGFTQRLLPRVEDRHETGLSLRQLGALMPYHTLLNADDMAGGLNFLIRQSRGQAPVFLELYSAAEIQEAPDKAETGLFVFGGKPGAPFAIIVPGGGFTYVATLHESLPLAHVLAEQGVNAFVLRYRTGQGQRAASEDLARAITLLFQNQGNLEISINGYSLWGASAGARLAALNRSYGPAAFESVVLPPPGCVVMLYTGHSETSDNEPATFAAVGDRDGISPPAVMRRRIKLLENAGTPVEFHVYPNVGHGFGLGTGSSAEGWTNNAIQFWRDQGTN